MAILNWFKKIGGNEKTIQKLNDLTEEKQRSIKQAIERHRLRINNLEEEYMILSNHLMSYQLDDALTTSEKAKQSDLAIRRMSLIKYEVGIREELIQWLS